MNHTPFVIFSLCAGVAAQVTETSPAGYLNQAGTSSQDIGVSSPGGIFGLNSARAHAQLDNTLVGSARTIQSLSFRRSVVAAADPSLTARTMTVTIRMAHADFGAISGGFQDFSTVLLEPWTDVLPPTTVSIPDMTAVPAQSPASWSIDVPLATSFNYNGTDALFYQVMFYDSGATPLFPLDGINDGVASSQGSAYGVGCQTFNGPYTASGGINVYAGNRDSEVWFGTGPILGGTFPAPPLNLIAVGTSPVNVPTAFCTPLQVDPIWTFPLTTGVISPILGLSNSMTPILVPHDPSFVGVEFFAQGWGVESNTTTLLGSQPWRTGPYPAKPVNVPQVALVTSLPIGFGIYNFTDSGTFQLGSALIVGLE